MSGRIQTYMMKLAQMLKTAGVCHDPSPILMEAGKIYGHGAPYRIQKLKLEFETVPPHSLPNGLLYIEVIIDVNFCINDIDENNIGTVISDCSFNILFQGVGDNKIYYFPMHLDYDINEENKEKWQYIHPECHLTYGGDFLKHKDTGEILILPTPRIPYLPMDFFLGVDFILSNFMPRDKYFECFMGDPEYKHIIQQSQNNIWRPYILSIAHHWCKFSNCQYNLIDKDLSKHLMPTLI